MSLFRNNPRTDDIPAVTTLNRRLEKEMQKRRGAENEVKRLKQNHLASEEAMDHFRCDCCSINFDLDSIKREGKQAYCPLCQHGLIPCIAP